MSGVYYACVRAQFSAAHTVKTKGKWEPVHGHNYQVSLCVGRKRLDRHGMVVDFTYLKEVLQTLLERVDHKVLVPSANPDVKIVKKNGRIHLDIEGRKYLFPVKDVVALPTQNTTAEEIAKWVFEGVKVAIEAEEVRVEVYESPTSYVVLSKKLVDD